MDRHGGPDMMDTAQRDVLEEATRTACDDFTTAALLYVARHRATLEALDVDAGGDRCIRTMLTAHDFAGDLLAELFPDITGNTLDVDNDRT